MLDKWSCAHSIFLSPGQALLIFCCTCCKLAGWHCKSLFWCRTLTAFCYCLSCYPHLERCHIGIICSWIFPMFPPTAPSSYKGGFWSTRSPKQNGNRDEVGDGAASSAQEFSDTRPAPYVNLTNSCFINATLQALYACPSVQAACCTVLESMPQDVQERLRYIATLPSNTDREEPTGTNNDARLAVTRAGSTEAGNGRGRVPQLITNRYYTPHVPEDAQ